MTEKELNLAIIGLDTSHSVEFPRRLQAPDWPETQKIKGMKAVSCLRFPTPFQTEEGQDERQKTLEGWGIKVTRYFDEAVKDVDAVLLEINDPAFHLEYFKKCAELGKPIFLDKPMADNISNGLEIFRIAKEKNLRVLSASSLRSTKALAAACEKIPAALYTSVFGPLGKAPAGSSIVWYGVHAFEMLQKAMGIGALSVTLSKVPAGVLAVVEYPKNRRGVVELTEGSYFYGGSLRGKDNAASYNVNEDMYSAELTHILEFFRGEKTFVSLEETLEVMAMLDAAERSFHSGKKESVIKE